MKKISNKRSSWVWPLLYKIYELIKDNPEFAQWITEQIKEIIESIRKKKRLNYKEGKPPKIINPQGTSTLVPGELQMMVCGKSYMPYPEWVFLLEAFRNLLSDYDVPPNDVGYWYGERALSGLLCVAAWKLEDGWGLEEFTGFRNISEKKTVGRGDLWISIGKKKDLTIEAKALWPTGNPKIVVKSVLKKLDEAGKQLDSLERSYRNGPKKTEICYVIPEFKEYGAINDPLKIREWFITLSELLELEKVSIGAFWYEDNPPYDDEKIYPGVLIISRTLPWKSNVRVKAARKISIKRGI
ncbi:hypothetical protein [Candidatus Nitronereus thalassa]|uniref:Uncharacterized protein n=1 Tax=Candidatus Nitronereus thalassa TaxID=3020898 RepID=A0ABU3K5U3_9BACT|nr:hypothetical protein [Candidatus Nitronereus thalassa]MDT7041770.1 hypothetical protein [Candidatus Nitronereus thalassa]